MNHIASNIYPWMTFARREGQDFRPHSQDLLAALASTGLQGYEPIIESPEEAAILRDRLSEHGLEMRSIYVNTTLHDAAAASNSIGQVVSIAESVFPLGTRIVVTNPSPIRWGGPENKDDGQLRHQAQALDTLGARLRHMGMVLAYHNHDIELRMGAREFHHMLTATDPDNVKFCLDAHWVFRGCGDSAVALFDALVHYHPRIVELHLRQSTAGIWQETFTMKGDVDYRRLFSYLSESDIHPHLVLEQAVEDGSPHTLAAVEAHRQSRSNLIQA